VLAAREGVGLAFVAALQHLPARQRAILILCDVVGWSAAEVAEMLELTVPAVTSALQRAHTSLRARLPAGGDDRSAAPAPIGEDQKAALKGFMDAWEQGDASLLTALLRDDARWAMPPAPLWFDGRAAITRMLALFPPNWQGRAFRMRETRANGQPAAAAYLRPAGGSAFELSALHVLRVQGGQIAEITTFSPQLCAAFQLPPTL
jgi:RNA polymerase sigma-70 factor (ECF subfamily)